MRRRYTRMAGILLGLAALAVVLQIAIRSVETEPDLDRGSYEKGYHALGGARLPPADERAFTEEYCARLWGEFPTDELAGVVKKDWIDGCADYREGRDPRFSSK